MKPIPKFRRERRPRRGATLVVAVAAGLIASLATAGMASAAPAGARLGAAGPGVTLSAPSGAGSSQATVKMCFYVFPHCTSTNPAVGFRVVSGGDTSACVFQTTADWGDGQSNLKTYPGGGPGATLATFTHTYDKSMPQTWTVTVTTVLMSGSCTTMDATWMFTLLPDLGAAAVRFAPLADQSANGTPGQPVIKDDNKSIVTDGKSGPESCNDIPSPREFDYLDCGTPVPTGTKSKNWPVIYAKGDSLTIDQVIFAANGQVPMPELTATASVSGSATASLTLAPTALSQAKVGSGYQLTGSSLTFTGALPDVPGADHLTIEWTVIDLASGLPVKTVTSEHAIYVTAGKYKAPTDVSAEDDKPYETVVDTGTVAASGISGEQKVFDAIWQKFTKLTIHHAILDLKTGSVSYGDAITYYNNGFTTLSDGFNGDRRGCVDLVGMLKTNSGHCGAWASFFAVVMAFQGIKTREAGLGDVTGPDGFDAGPAPGGGCKAIDCAYMLVDPKLWHFKDATAGGNYPFRDKLTVTPGGKIDITGKEVTYASTADIAQGPVRTPPMWFTDGDHAIDEVSLPDGKKWVDPSYGDPMPPLAPFATVKDYEPHALAGFAVVYKKVGAKLKPLPATYDESDIANACRSATCYFQAVKGT